MGTWREVPVTADVAIEVEASSLEDLFETAAEGMLTLMFGSLAREGNLKETFTVEGEDLEDCLVNFLSEILYMVEVKRIVPSRIEVKALGDKKFKVEITADRFDPQKYTLETEIKAPTYHELKIEQVSSRWKVKIVFDV